MPLNEKDRAFLVSALRAQDSLGMETEAQKAVDAECKRLRLIAQAALDRAERRPTSKGRTDRGKARR